MFPWKKNAEAEEPETEVEAAVVGSDTEVVLVGGDESVVWDIVAEPFNQFPAGDAAAVFRAVEAHGAKHDGVEYYAVDLSNTLQGEDPARVALNLREAWDLSVALVEELNTRAESMEGAKRLIVVLNDGNDLFADTEPEDADLYQRFLGNMTTVGEHGRAYGVAVLTLPGNVHRESAAA